MLRLNDLHNYNNKLADSHSNARNTGYEIHDRNIFLNDILKPLGYKENNILIDVPQRGSQGSKSPDIRIFGKHEYKSKHSYSQFIIETINYKLISENNYDIDYLQLKRYIKFNESKIRLIGLTDYQTFILFNATEIKKDSKINFTNLDKISKREIEIFKQNILMVIDLSELTENTINKLNILRHKKIFEDQKFINPQEFEETNSINNPYVRKNFIFELYHLMIRLKNQIVPNFETKIIDIQSRVTMKSVSWNDFRKLIMGDSYKPISNYFWWGIEMNYIENFMENKEKYDINVLNDFLSDREKKDSFVLTSIYNIINKTMFLRILEDSSTKSTKFIEGLTNGRYLSNGILEQKRKEGKESLLRHFISVFRFDQSDLKPYSFILSKDIYNWILDESEYSITDLLIELIRLFNDINFNKINQDILGDIYEHYLEQEEDIQSRKSARMLLGQYYTPKPIVRLMMYLTRDIIKKNYNRDLFESGQNNLNIIDPACGSGTFISEAILHINEAASKTKINKNGKVFHFIKDKTKKIENNLFGFELNPLSKSIADINLFFALIQAYGDFSSENKIDYINVYRTNSLELNEGEECTNDFSMDESILFFKSEIQKSKIQTYNLNLAKSKKYNIVIGNPPYGSTKVNAEMKKNLIPFAYAENNFDSQGINTKFKWDATNFSGKVPKNEKNIGKLNDLYALFFGVADRLCENKGIISFITANSYLTIPSYKWFRKYILENYTIDYIINFNRISEKSNSMFYPDAGIATCIIIMRKQVPNKEHEINYIDLSTVESIKDKYDAFCDITWAKKSGNIDKNDIKNFIVKPLDKLIFKQMLQSNIYLNKDYIFSLHDISKNTLLNKIEEKSIKVTTYGSKNTGIDVGDMSLVKKNKIELEDVIKSRVFNKDFSSLSSTLSKYLKEQFKKNKIKTDFDENKIERFVFQKHLMPFSYKETSLVYFDKDILWRHRLKNQNDIYSNPIHSNVKLFILERRAKGQVLSLVTTEKILPQHGGRFMYLVPSETCDIDTLYFISGVINSKVTQYLYKNRLMGNKDILIPSIEKVSKGLRQIIIKASKKIHELEKYKRDYINEVDEKITPYNEKVKINIFTENKYWSVIEEESLIADYNVDEAVLDQKSKSILLNNHLYITTHDKEILNSIFKQIKDYRGNLINKPLFINILKLTNKEEEHLLKIESEINNAIDDIDSSVYDIYDLSNEEINQIISH